MVGEYEKSLHAPLKWKTMESAGQPLDEGKLDAAIADLMRCESALDEDAPKKHTLFPELAAE